MSYVNPIFLLELPDPFSPAMMTPAFLKREKKRILAEFELERTATIEIGSRELDKDTVLTLFEELENDELRQHHLRIFMEAGLMEFLEDASLEYFYNGSFVSLVSHSNEFLAYIGPYFAKSYNQRLFHAFRQKDWEEIDVMCKHPLPLSAVNKAQCYQDTYRQLHVTIQEMEAYVEALQQGEMPDGRIQEYGDELMIDSLNSLPEYFRSSRDSYALALESLALSIYNDHQRIHLSIFLLRQALKLNISQDTEDRIKNLLDQILAQNPLAGPTTDIFGGFSKKKKKENWWMWIGAGTMLSFLLWVLFG